MEVSGKRKDSSESHTKPGCQDDVRLYCQPCQKDGLMVPAHGYCQDCTEHLCESCYKTHRKPTPCRHHVLLDKSKMPRSQSSSQLKVPHDLTEQCKQHRGKLIEYFCCDHNILGCSPCITVSHRNCKVDYIPDVSENYVASNAYKQIVHALKTLQENFKRIIDGAKRNRKMILENKATVNDEIKKFRQEINSMFDNLEANLQKEADDLFAEGLARTDNIATTSAKLLEDIENLQDDINKLEKANKTNALYIKSKANEELVHVDFTSTMVQTQNNNTVSTFAFQPNLILKEILLGSETRMGELHKSGTESLLSASSKFKDMHTENILQMTCSSLESRTGKDLYEKLKAEPSGEINIKFLFNNTCCIPGAVSIAEDTVAVTDEINRFVILVNTKKEKVVSKKRLSSSPGGLDIILPNNLLAIALKEEEMLVFLSIPDGLSEVRHLKLDGKCQDLASHDGKLIVTFKDPGKIQIMNLNGHIFKTIENIFSNNRPCSSMVTVSRNKNIYISEYFSSTITCMNWDGEVTNTYKDKHLVKPCGMVVLEDGSILVCSSRDNTIHIISKNLENGRVILEAKDGLLCPYSLALDSDKNKLYVGSGDTCNFLKVYDLN
ncbi:uncharacterized protein LOC128554290 [Mercenaria mercenaria]|uniref:uncharacterized protein LOC128554290 n=1 Tax=Mercenaria mercenaria TaxID=6596 RepID=UPI00234EE09E|nr:uncharacterized protein LOC128554290 [Mercenaria mercenaria]